MNPTPNGAHSHFANIESSTRSESPCFVRVTVSAEGPFEALGKANLQQVPLLQAALSLRQEGLSHRIQLVAVDGPGGMQGLSGQAAVALFKDEPLDHEGVERVRQNHTALTSNAAARRAAMLLARGIRLLDLGSDVALVGASLLAHFQVLEAVGTSIPAEPPKDYGEQRTQLMEALRAELDSPATPSKKATAIRRCEADLGRLDAKYTSLRIANAGAVLGMSQEWQSAATALGKLRNTKLGHSAESVPFSEFAPWLPQGTGIYGFSALSLAKSLLDAWIERLVNG
ncbi:hypothetical protein [Blastococcus aggregatus]|uniref:hypothetical protein n=1 Tax=Blastococcus aggregatus TaxID=38502 RepID=UPI0011411592|nr:hypothetical protein [Blastococcus aggregatus]